MEAGAKILTLHPEGKKGTRIDLKKYSQIKSAILAALESLDEASLDDLVKAVEEIVRDQFEGKVVWYVVTVKLDLEARKIIERIPKTSPHRVRLAKV